MTSGIICCLCSIPANSVLQFALKQWRKDDEPYCKGAVERIILDSVSPEKKSYENQNPWSTTAEKEEGPGRPDVGSDRKTAFDYYYHEQFMESFSSASYSKWDDDHAWYSQEWKTDSEMCDRPGRPDVTLLGSDTRIPTWFSLTRKLSMMEQRNPS